MLIEEYKKLLWRMYETDNSLPIGMQQPQHVAALYELFFTIAKKEIVMLCAHFSEDIFNRPETDLLSPLEGALRRGVIVRVLMGCQPNVFDCSILKRVKHRGDFSFVSEIDDPYARTYGFCIVDKKAFRFENRSQQPIVAFANMNESKDAQQLYEAFDRMWEIEVPF